MELNYSYQQIRNLVFLSEFNYSLCRKLTRHIMDVNFNNIVESNLIIKIKFLEDRVGAL